ncbi:branched-chain amino acid ABC transporter substrate-binding protein [Kerstersia gyiorum]|uniref:ABC transporter substrate-binding protein n=1 Tax=Kerstersia gyiorum TaxID=206506 RepID=UPI00107141E7|nr:ABC transporter substrate-binding protein [Kerstersia gyiorum]QBR39643.1 branched-chain amino acid ABC transporter substrate-binding protein [Kerstersia gyiorum]
MTQQRFLPRRLASLALAAIIPLSAAAADKDPIRIGTVTSVSGVFSQQGEEVQRAVQFAVEQANRKGGIDGRAVELKIADDESTPDAGRRAAEKLARDGHNLLVAPIASSITLAVGQGLERWDAMQVVHLSKADRITGDSCKPRMFRSSHSDSMDLAMFDEWLKEVPEKKFAVVGADYVWGRDSAEHFQHSAARLGKEIALSVFPPVGTKDFAPYIAQIKAQPDIDGIWVALVGRDLIAFAKQAHEFGLTDKRIIGHAYIMNFVVNATGNATQGVWGNIGYSPDIDTARNHEFVTEFQEKYGRAPTDNEGQAYNAVQTIFEGVKLAGSTKPGEVSRALRGATYDTIYGPATMRAEDNQLVLPTYIGQVEAVDGKLRPVVKQAFGPDIVPAPTGECKM